MVYKMRTGISWRDLSERNGPWQTVYTRFRRYVLDGSSPRGLQQIPVQAAAAGDVDWQAQIDSAVDLAALILGHLAEHSAGTSLDRLADTRP